MDVSLELEVHFLRVEPQRAPQNQLQAGCMTLLSC